MRDPARIPIILRRLEAAWAKAPDLRLAQLIAGAAGYKDPYFIEDEPLTLLIEELVKGIGAKA